MQTNSPDFLKSIAVKRIDNYPGKPTIVFLHDSLGCITLWRDFPEKLGELTQCNVLIYDRQGYGNSCPFTYDERDILYMENEADILIDLLNYWKIEKVILFGHSDGGSIALIAVGKYPDRFMGVITEGAHIFVEDVTVSGIKAAVDLYQTTDLKTKLAKYHGDKTDAMFRAWAGTWTTNAFYSWNIEKFLPSIKCPVLIIQGEQDEYGTLKQVERIIAQTSGPAHKLVLPNVKHSPHKKAPDIIWEAATDFIKGEIKI
jgi:pimeloyl-ACP methyl ester carboxylesterase